MRHFDCVPQDYHRRERRLFACDSMKHCAVVFALFLFLAVIRQSAVTQFSCSVFRVDFRRSLPSGLRSSGVGDKSGTSVSGSSSPPSLLTFVRRILMKCGGYERAQSSACLWDSGLMGFFQDGKIALAKVFTSMFWFHFLPTGTNLDDKMHKTARQLRKRRYV